MKKWMVALFVLGSVLSLTGCGKATSSTEDTPALSVVNASTDDEAYALQQVQKAMFTAATPDISVGAFSIQNGEPIPNSIYFKGTLLTVQMAAPPAGTPFPSSWYSIFYKGQRYWLTALSRSQNGEYRVSFKTASALSGQQETYAQVDVLRKTSQTDLTQSEVSRTVSIRHGVFETTVSESMTYRVGIADQNGQQVGTVTSISSTSRVYAQGGAGFAQSQYQTTSSQINYTFSYNTFSFLAATDASHSGPVSISPASESNRVVGVMQQGKISVYRNGALVELPAL